MSSQAFTEIEVLPLVPEVVLKKHHCHEPLDGRFRSAARLLQAIWRKDRGLPIGSYKVEGGDRRKLGSRISNAAGLAGGNFLTPEIAYAVRRELAYREIGAMIEEERLLTNLLSSMPLCFNLFVPLKQELAKATCALHELIPSYAGDVQQILFEHSPGRGSAQFTADHSAFDVFIRYLSPEGRRGFVAIEMKYSEGMSEPLARLRPRYDELSRSSGLFIDPDGEDLRKNPFQQLWREHMLAQAMVDLGLYDEGTFVAIAPRHNWLAQEALGAYDELLADPSPGKVRFVNLTLEDVIEVIRLSDPLHAAALHRRYCDWWLVDGEIELELASSPKKRRAQRAPDTYGREVLTGV
jgi:hypothetical protein